MIQDKRKAHRPTSPDSELINMQRALFVIDRQAAGVQRSAAIYDASKEFGCGKRTIQTALSEHEEWLKPAPAEDLDRLRRCAIK